MGWVEARQTPTKRVSLKRNLRMWFFEPLGIFLRMVFGGCLACFSKPHGPPSTARWTGCGTSPCGATKVAVAGGRRVCTSQTRSLGGALGRMACLEGGERKVKDVKGCSWKQDEASLE